MDTDSESDNHSVTQEQSTGHYEEGEVSQTRPLQRNRTIEKQCVVYIPIWAGQISQILIHILPVLRTTLLLHPNNSQQEKSLLLYPQMIGCAGKWMV